MRGRRKGILQRLRFDDEPRKALAVRAHKKGIELIYHVQSDVPDALVGDAGRLRQILLNLVGNAIKFTDIGEVVIAIRMNECTTMNDDNGSSVYHPSFIVLNFCVRDTGIGISPDQQERIFLAFEQEDTSTTRRYGGTGLGLTIAARLVAIMGGEITVESEPGHGSTFAFTARFDRQPSRLEAAQPRAPVVLYDVPVLVIDDNATNRHILQEWLRGWRMRPSAVADAPAALDAMRQAAAGGRAYPLVLLDVRMPDTDGMALAEQIRHDPELFATRVILLTSGDRPGDPRRARELWIDAHLLKPVSQIELLDTILRVMSRAAEDRLTIRRVDQETHRDSPAELKSRPVASAAPLQVLVAEDNEFNAQLLEQLLKRRGHRVQLATNGRETLSLAKAESFDLLLLDVHMPELDGFQVVAAIRERERQTGGHLPVIALTARSRIEDRERCLAAGMDDFLAKPIQAADLWATIDRVVGTRRAADPSVSALLDSQVLLAACGGDAAVLGKLCQTFRSRLPDHLQAVHGALRDGDPPRLREASHKLTGMISTFSTIAGSIASDLEDRAARGQLEGAAALVHRLDQMCVELVQIADAVTIESLRIS